MTAVYYFQVHKLIILNLPWTVFEINMEITHDCVNKLNIENLLLKNQLKVI